MSESTTAVDWHHTESVPEPLVRRVPYLELKLEHPGLEPAGFGDRFFPDAVPYERRGEGRVFYWQPTLADRPTGAAWTVAVATTEGVAGRVACPAAAPPLVDRSGDGVAAVVDGTVGGESTRAHLAAYDPPTVRVAGVAPAAVELAVAGETETVAAGERRRIALGNRSVATDEGTTTVTPELVVRYPGRRTLYHPSPGTDTRLFPAFGLDLDAIPAPMSVPTAGGELDHESLAERLGVDLAARPYPERVLWQAVAYTVFDPHGDGPTSIGRARTGHLVIADER